MSEEGGTKKYIQISCVAGELLAERLVLLFFKCFVERRFWKEEADLVMFMGWTAYRGVKLGL